MSEKKKSPFLDLYFYKHKIILQRTLKKNSERPKKERKGQREGEKRRGS
jgi:hypothetical protein